MMFDQLKIILLYFGSASVMVAAGRLTWPHLTPHHFLSFTILHLMTSTCTLTMLCADTFV